MKFGRCPCPFYVRRLTLFNILNAVLDKGCTFKELKFSYLNICNLGLNTPLVACNEKLVNVILKLLFVISFVQNIVILGLEMGHEIDIANCKIF